MHQTCSPPILYFGTPVILVSSLNEDGSTNLAPMSSAWWLGQNCVLGFGARSQTPRNILRTRECVLNLPSVAEADAVDRLAKTSGADPLPPHKVAMGYRHVADKFSCAGLTPLASTRVAPARVKECPVHLEARLTASHGLREADPELRGRLISLEVEVLAVHVEASLLAGPDRIDPHRWKPLLMSFQELFGLTAAVRPSTLATIPEAMYRQPRRPS